MISSPDDAATTSQRHRALVVVAAGSGTRLGLGVPKAAADLAGRTILDRALDALTTELALDLVVLVLPAEADAHRRLMPAASSAAARSGAEVIVVHGGAARTESVAAGSAAAAEQAQLHGWNPDAVSVLIHDAARALAPTSVFERVLTVLDSGAEAVVPVVAVTDTIKRVDAAGSIEETLARAELRAAQTPQGFTLSLLQRAADYVSQHRAAAQTLTDEAMIAEHLGADVTTVEGDPRSLKITTAADLLSAEALLRAPNPHAAQRPEDRPAEATEAGSAPEAARTSGQTLPRVGIGQDIHGFAPQGAPAPLWLAGLHWPGEQGLAGHSDGDAVAHACCDALFSAAGLGDLGVHFGTDRPELAGASGSVLLREAADIVRAAGFTIGSLAVQFIGSRPKFGPRRAEAQRVLSEAVGAPVAVSATTSDGLGFTGRGEGISATATAVLVADA